MPVNLHQNVQARLQVLERHDHLVPAIHHEREVKHHAVHRDAFVDEDGLDLRLVQELLVPKKHVWNTVRPRQQLDSCYTVPTGLLIYIHE